MSQHTSAAATDAARLARNAVDSLPEGALEAKLAEASEQARPLRVKLGIDPTAPDIHLGHAVVLGKLREFQDAGHVVVLIIGDYTARVGDPSGRSTLRPMLSPEEIDANGATFQEQAARILDLDPRKLEVRHNGEWLDMPMADLLSLVRTTTAAQLLEREDFAQRWQAGEPISMLELLYPLLQGYDSVVIDADVELGGTDQTFNLLLGRDIQRHYGKPQQAIMTMPILVGTDGSRKMSKSLGNQIGITDEPGEMFGKAMSIPDEAMGEYYRLLIEPHSPDAAVLGSGRTGGERMGQGVRPTRAAGGDRGGDVAGRGDRARAGADRRSVRHLALGGTAAARAGWGVARLRAARQRRSGAAGLARRRAGAAGRPQAVPAPSGGRLAGCATTGWGAGPPRGPGIAMHARTATLRGCNPRDGSRMANAAAGTGTLHSSGGAHRPRPRLRRPRSRPRRCLSRYTPRSARRRLWALGWIGPPPKEALSRRLGGL